MMMVGLALSGVAAYKFTTDTNYGSEEGVVVPAEVEREVGIKTDDRTLQEVGIPAKLQLSRELSSHPAQDDKLSKISG